MRGAPDDVGVLPEIKKMSFIEAGSSWMDAISGTRITAVDLGDVFPSR